jgi:hypothetical protein
MKRERHDPEHLRHGGIQMAKQARAYAAVAVLGALPAAALTPYRRASNPGAHRSPREGDRGWRVVGGEGSCNHLVEARRCCAGQVAALGSKAEGGIAGGRGKHELRCVVPLLQDIGDVAARAPVGGGETVGEGIRICP